jgi:ligand-binding sensor domain-containing protein
LKIAIPFLLIVLFCSLPFSGNSQEYHYKHYDITNGLAGNNVYHSIEDKEGFMWFATETGVSRFDGTSFKNFTTAEGLPDNEILKLFVDSRGRVWMLPFKNTVCYYYKGKIYNPDNDSVLHKVKIDDCVSTMFEDGSGDLFFLMQKSLMVIKKDGAILGSNDDTTKLSIYGGGLDSELNPLLFLGGDTHLYRVETGSGKIIYKKMPDSIRFYGNNILYSHISHV